MTDSISFVVGTARYEVQLRPNKSEIWTKVDVTRGGESWEFDAIVGYPLAFGASAGVAYFWAGAGVVEVPESGEPTFIPTDWPLLYAQRDVDGWVLVCQADIRRVVDGVETDRLGSGEVVVGVEPEGGRLRIRDSEGRQFTAWAVGNRLESAPDEVV